MPNKALLVRPAKQGPAFRVLATSRALRLAGFDSRPLRLIKGNAKRLRSCRRSALVLGLRPRSACQHSHSDSGGRGTRGHLRLATPLLDVVFTSLLLTPRHHDNAFVVESGNDLVPGGNLLYARVVRVLRALEEIRLDRLE